MKRLLPSILPAVLVLSGAASLPAQVPDAPAPTNTQTQSAPPAQPSSAPANGGGNSNGNGGNNGNTTLGKDAPFFDPGSEVLSWDGKHWNINNNRLFSARFEKYLNSEAETGADAAKYRQIITTILARLSPYQINPGTLDEAFRLLPEASNFEIDANLSDALASSVYSVWQARREDGRLLQANQSLDNEARGVRWNARVTSQTNSTEVPVGKNEQARYDKDAATRRTIEMDPYVKRMAEIQGMRSANLAKRELSELQSKVEFQALVVQFFIQRRFQHVLMGTMFYRNIFGDGDTTLKLNGEAKKLFDTTTGMPPTVSVLDSLAKEAMRDAREGVESYKFLLGKNELESATKRLAEAFAVGEFMPELRTLSRDDKRQALMFTQKSNQLISALEVKDYTLAEKIVHELETTAKDFDNSKPMAAIETARTVAAMHLAKARNAAVSNDRVTLEAELKEATEIWPRNPALADLSTSIFSQSDVQSKALLDFDQLRSQHNYRQIYDDRMRFIAATAMSPERQTQLKEVLGDMQTIEEAILKSQEIAKHGDYAGAWETVEQVFKKYPDDNKLNQVRATMTTEAADFVRTLRTAEQLEDKGQVGSSLAWYLKAQKIYPPSEYASEAVTRLVKQVLPES